MKIEVKNISKKFGKNQIIKDFSASFEAGNKYAITGPNGKGKSTLLKIVSGFLSPDHGKVEYFSGNSSLTSEQASTFVFYTAPYVSLQEDMTLDEAFDFISNFRELTTSKTDFFAEFDLSSEKKISELSTGMTQRFYLGLAFRVDSQVLFLDEPTSFLDKKWKEKYQSLLKSAPDKLLILLATNDNEEYQYFNNVIQL